MVLHRTQLSEDNSSFINNWKDLLYVRFPFVADHKFQDYVITLYSQCAFYRTSSEITMCVCDQLNVWLMLKANWNPTPQPTISPPMAVINSSSIDMANNLTTSFINLTLSDNSTFDIDDSLVRSGSNLTKLSDQDGDQSEFSYSTLVTIAIAACLSILTLLTAVGNLFVIVAIRTDRNLRSAQNNLVFSLAVADLMVSLCVMPFAVIAEVHGEWRLGALWCDIYTSADVLSCTASILHLLAIALDRYWAVTNIDYIQRRSPTRILLILAAVWGVAVIVSLAPILGWKDEAFDDRIRDKHCMVSQDMGYQIFATCATFYGPVILILLLYWKIYQVMCRFMSISVYG